MKLRSLSLASVIVLGMLGWLAAPAAAQRGPEKVFAGKIMTSDKPYPSYAKSVNAYVAAIRKQSKNQFWEDKDKKTWKIHFAAFFKRPLGDLEVLVKLYDVSSGAKTMMASFEQFLDQRGQRALLSQFTLDRKQVGANKQVLMTVEVAGVVVATGKFKILGKTEAYTGKVNFSDDDTKAKDDNE
jgi:hypothetical protein